MRSLFMPARRQVLSGALAAAAFGGIGRGAAQSVDKTVHVIAGFAAGGGTDLSARLFAERIRGAYAPVVIVDNKVGVAGRLAVEFVKSAPADGSVILFTPDFPITLYPHIYKQLSYDPLRDLTPVAPLTKSALVLSVGPQVPEGVVTVKGFLDWCRANPDKANFATTGAGGSPHFAGVMLSRESGVRMLPVHYRGGAPALQDLLGGHVASGFNPAGEVMPHARSGIRMLAVITGERSRFLPDIPTLLELGYNIRVDTWSGAFLPAKTPAGIVAALSAAFEKATQSADLIEAHARLGSEMAFQPPAVFASTVKASLESWGAIVASSGFVPED